MGDTVTLRYSISTYGVHGYLDWTFKVRNAREAHWVVRRWLRSKSRHDPDEQSARKDKLFKAGKAFQRRVAIDQFAGTRYGPQRKTEKQNLRKLICYRPGGELEIVLYLPNISCAIPVGQAWAREAEGNSYRIPLQMQDPGMRKAWKRSGPPWNGKKTYR